MGLLESLREAECLHEGDRNYRLEENAVESTTTVCCAECGALLRTTWHGPGSIKEMRVETRNTFHDDVYYALYTRKGRKSLLRESLKELGVRYPEAWDQ